MRIRLGIILLLFVSSTMSMCNAQITNLPASAFETAINKDTVQILDVRTPGEFESGHIKGALQADWNNEAEYTRRIAFVDKTKPVYVYCLAGGRSAAAAKQMRASGFKNVYELTGGINAWKAEGKPLEGKSDAPQMTTDELNTAINTNKTLLVDFGASWCPPCRKMEPVLKSLQANNPGKFTIVKVDGSKDQDLLKAYKVTALPVFILFKNGKQVWRKEGIVAEKEIADML